MDTIMSIKVSHYIIGAMGIVAALGWRDLIIHTVNELLPMSTAAVIFVRALISTVILILFVCILPDTTSELPDETQKKIRNWTKGPVVQVRSGI